MGYFISSLEELLKKQGKSYLMHMNLKKNQNQNTMAIKCPKTAISNSFFFLIQKQLPNNTTPNQWSSISHKVNFAGSSKPIYTRTW